MCVFVRWVRTSNKFFTLTWLPELYSHITTNTKTDNPIIMLRIGRAIILFRLTYIKSRYFSYNVTCTTYSYSACCLDLIYITRKIYSWNGIYREKSSNTFGSRHTLKFRKDICTHLMRYISAERINFNYFRYQREPVHF